MIIALDLVNLNFCVVEDYEDYELEWMELKQYLMSFGKQYPDETKFMFEPDKPEDHIIESDEDMLGESTVPLA